MKTNKLFLLFILSLVAIVSCKKDEDPYMTTFKINKESEKIEVGTTEAVISGTYEYPGKVDRINVRVGTSEQLFGSEVHEADMNGKAYSVHLTGLHPGTVYYYRYEVDFGSNNEFQTDIYSFTTLAETPIVKTLEVQALDSTTFRVKCEVLSSGGSEVTERGICWNNYGDPTIDDELIKYSSGGVGQYTIRMENMALCKKYFVRAYAKSEKGVGYGEELEFETASVPGMPVTIFLDCYPADGGTIAGEGVYAVGSQCTVMATANPSYTFINWTENGVQVSSDASYIFNVTLERHLVANFSNQAYVIKTLVDPQDSGDVTGAGGYNSGDECVLSATARAGYTFAKWTKNGNLVSTDARYAFTVTESATYVAQFQAQGPHPDNYTINVSANPSNGGTVTGGGSFEYGQPCTLTATPNPSFAFVKWTKGDTTVSTSPTYTFTVNESADYVAEFAGTPTISIEVVNRSKTSISTKTRLLNFAAGSITERGICYGQSPDLTYYSHETIPYSGDDNEFYIDITGLIPGDRYYMRSYVRVNGEFNYSPVIDTLTVYPWYYVTDIPGQSRTQSFSFAIGSKAYVGTGVYQNYMYLEDMWEYDTETGVWTQKANYPEGKVRGPMAFTLNNKAYVGLGYRENGTNEGEKMDTFYEYDPVMNSWTRKHDYPGGWDGYNSRDAFSMNGNGYFVTEMYPVDVPTAPHRGMNIYEYNPDMDRWSIVNTLEWNNYNYFDTYSYISADAVEGNIYCYIRYDNGWNGNDLQAFYQYNMEYNTWVEKSCPFPITYTKMECFVMGDSFYLFSGNLYAGVHNTTVYKYYPATDNWTQNEVSEPKIFRYNPVNLMINGKLYYGGGDYEGSNQRSLWVYDPSLE